MKKLLLLSLLLLLLTACREQPKEYESPDYQKIRDDFAPTEYVPTLAPTDSDEPTETVVVTPMMPLK